MYLSKMNISYFHFLFIQKETIILINDPVATVVEIEKNNYNYYW